jgi:dTDP-glucose 4,6-dehydratase
MVLNALEGKPLPIYGKGDNIRDWLFVGDHASAIWAVASNGRVGETYLVGGNSEKTNLEVVEKICAIVEEFQPSSEIGSRKELIRFVADRPGHDFRYAINPQKIRSELGWSPKESFDSGLRSTVRWYLDNPEWVAAIRSGEYRTWLETNYAQR